MSNSIAYLTSKANFLQVSPEVPITKQRNPEKVDPPAMFEGNTHGITIIDALICTRAILENKKELVTDLMVKAKQVEYLINALPVPEPEETQVCSIAHRMRRRANTFAGPTSAILGGANEPS